MSEDDAEEAMIVYGPNSEQYVEQIQKFVGAGIDDVYLHHLGQNQEAFIEFLERECSLVLLIYVVEQKTNNATTAVTSLKAIRPPELTPARATLIDTRFSRFFAGCAPVVLADTPPSSASTLEKYGRSLSFSPPIASVGDGIFHLAVCGEMGNQLLSCLCLTTLSLVATHLMSSSND